MVVIAPLKVQMLVEALPSIREFSVFIKAFFGSENQQRTYFPWRFPVALVLVIKTTYLCGLKL